MQQDPVFKQLVKKSFILKKFPDLEIPIVRKPKKFKHEVITTLSLTTFIHLFIYPIDTIKTRTIANNVISDIAKFTRNNVGEKTTYLGIARGYGSLMIGNLCHLTIGRESLVLAATVEGILKTWIDMSKISMQMANLKGDLEIMKKSFLPCAFFGVLRDVIFRTSYVYISSELHKDYLATSQFYDQRKRFNNIFIATIISTIISQPFDVCFIKTASQRQLIYESIRKIPNQIIQEQGFNKLLFGGLWARLAYNLISTSMLTNAYQFVLEASIEAF